MTIREIVEKHPNRYVVLCPHEKNANGFVTSWKVLNESSILEEAELLGKQYIADGLAGVVIYNTSEPEDGSQTALVAEFFRIAFGMED